MTSVTITLDFNYSYQGKKKHIVKMNVTNVLEEIRGNGIDYDIDTINDRGLEFSLKIEGGSFKEIKDFNYKNMKKIEITSNITNIGYATFFQCEKLETVILPETLTTIGQGAFNDCEKLKSINIPNSVTSIGNGTFRGCRLLESIRLPDNLDKINYGLFADCENLKSVNIPDNVTEIEGEAFYRCSALQSVTIPDSVTSIGSQAFSNCYKLNSLIIPESVVTIHEEALTGFKGPEGTKKIYMSNYNKLGWTEETGKTISKGFIQDDQPNIISYFDVEFPTIVTYQLSDDNNNIKGYETKIFTDDEINITDLLKERSKNDIIVKVNIGSKVTKIKSGTFISDKVQLKQLTIGNNVTEIGKNIIKNNGIYTNSNYPYELRFGKISKLTKIDEKAFFENNFTNRIDIPDGVVNIGNSAFSNVNQNIEFMCTLPNSITSIGESAFLNSGINSIQLPKNKNFTTIKENTFGNTQYLKHVIIPDNVTTIERLAFVRTNLINMIIIGNNLNKVNQQTFVPFKYQSSDPDYESWRVKIENLYITKGLEKKLRDQSTIQNRSESIIHFNGRTKTNFNDSDVFNLIVNDNVPTITIPEVAAFSIPPSLVVAANLESSINQDKKELGYIIANQIVRWSVDNDDIELTNSKDHKNKIIVSLKKPAEIKTKHTYTVSVASLFDQIKSFTKTVTVVDIPIILTSNIKKYIFQGDTNLGSITANEKVKEWSVDNNDVTFTNSENQKNTIIVSLKNAVTTQKSYTFTITATDETNTTTMPVTVTVNNLPTIEISGKSNRFDYRLVKISTVLKNRDGEIQLTNGVLDIYKALETYYNLNIEGAPSIDWSKEGSSLLTILNMYFQEKTDEININIKGNGIEIKNFNSSTFAPLVAADKYNINIEGVTNIHNETFKGLTNLHNITLPNTLKTIGKSAFSECSKLKSINLPNSLKTIGTLAFSKCSNLRSISIPDSVTDIGGSTFEYCTALSYVKLSENMTKFYSSFFRTTSLKQIYIPENVEFEMNAFWSYPTKKQFFMSNYHKQNRKEVTNDFFGQRRGNVPIVDNVKGQALYFDVIFPTIITSDKGDSNKNIDRYINNFFQPDQMNSDTIQKFINNYNLINKNSENDIIVKIIVGSQVEKIDSEAFKSDKIQLKQLTLGNNITEIGENIVPSKDGRIPEYELRFGKRGKLTKIGKKAFFENNFTNNTLVIPDGVVDIGEGAFSHEDVTKSKKFICTLPNTITSIGESAFLNSGIILIKLPNNSKLTTIEKNTFKNAQNLKDVFIPDNITTIKEGAFWSTNIDNIVIGNGLEQPSNIFKDSDSIKNLYVTKNNKLGITKSQDNATIFSVKNVKIHLVNKLPDEYTIKSKKFLEETKKEQQEKGIKEGTKSDTKKEENPDVIITLQSGGKINITLQESEKGVLGEIGTSPLIETFSDLISQIESVIIQGKITSIGNRAFHSCSKLNSITISNSVTSIGDAAFHSCSKLNSITIPNSVTSIGDRAFHSCSELNSITIPNSVTSIGDGTFANCVKLSKLTISNRLKKLPDYTFRGCTALTSVTIPDNVTSIGDYTFRGCNKLNNVKIGNSVKTIGDYTFAYCSALTTIEIPDSVTTIGTGTFNNCTDLRMVRIGRGITSIGYIFVNSPIAKIYIYISNAFKVLENLTRKNDAGEDVTFSEEEMKFAVYSIGEKSRGGDEGAVSNPHVFECRKGYAGINNFFYIDFNIQYFVGKNPNDERFTKTLTNDWNTYVNEWLLERSKFNISTDKNGNLLLDYPNDFYLKEIRLFLFTSPENVHVKDKIDWYDLEKYEAYNTEDNYSTGGTLLILKTDSEPYILTGEKDISKMSLFDVDKMTDYDKNEIYVVGGSFGHYYQIKRLRADLGIKPENEDVYEKEFTKTFKELKSNIKFNNQDLELQSQIGKPPKEKVSEKEKRRIKDEKEKKEVKEKSRGGAGGRDDMRERRRKEEERKREIEERRRENNALFKIKNNGTEISLKNLQEATSINYNFVSIIIKFENLTENDINYEQTVNALNNLLNNGLSYEIDTKNRTVEVYSFEGDNYTGVPLNENTIMVFNKTVKIEKIVEFIAWDIKAKEEVTLSNEQYKIDNNNSSEDDVQILTGEAPVIDRVGAPVTDTADDEVGMIFEVRNHIHRRIDREYSIITTDNHKNLLKDRFNFVSVKIKFSNDSDITLDEQTTKDYHK